MATCQVCGNDIRRDLRICPYCEGEQELVPGLGAAVSPPLENPRRHYRHAAVLSPVSLPEQTAPSRSSPAAAIFHKVVNLETGRPFVETALRKLEIELADARQQNLRVLTVIHGYGSSGKGGVIGVECRKFLEYLKNRGEINTFIPGEDFRQKSGPTRNLLRRFPRLADNVNLNKGNRGITLVVL
jgi:hypothetical protein